MTWDLGQGLRGPEEPAAPKPADEVVRYRQARGDDAWQMGGRVPGALMIAADDGAVTLPDDIDPDSPAGRDIANYAARVGGELRRMREANPRVPWGQLHGLDTVTVAAEVYRNQLARDPLVRRMLAEPAYQQAVQRHEDGTHGSSWKLTHAWMALAEQRSMAAMFATCAYETEDNWPFDLESLAQVVMREEESAAQNEFAIRQMALSIGADMNTADCYLWSRAMVEAADSAPLPPHIVDLEQLVPPSGAMYWTWDVAETTGLIDGSKVESNWMLVERQGEQIWMFGDLTAENGRIYIFAIPVHHQDEWPKSFETPVQSFVERLLRRCAFLNSDFTTVDSRPLERHMRKQLKRDGARYDPERLRVNTIRVVRGPAALQRQRAGGYLLEHDHSWWVKGHYRAQWYPTREAHQLKWIAPHVAGPPDKPLRASSLAGTVRRVR